MKWHRLFFWSIFIFFWIAGVLWETNHIEKETVIKFMLFLLCTAAGILFIDFLFQKLFTEKRYILFIGAAFITSVFIICLELITEYLFLGPYPPGKKEKLLENTALMVPWLIIGIIIFIAEDSGRQKLEKINTELLYLKHQVNPHFLLNTHNNINFLIEHDPMLASDALLKLSAIMQYMIYECSAATVSLQKELNNLADYIELEKLRKNEHMNISYDFSVQETGFMIAPLLLITFVENAFKHLSNFRDRENAIRTTAKVKGNTLYFDVSNTTSNNPSEKHAGIGLSNVKKRLRLLYPRKYDLKIKIVCNEYSVRLTINLK